MSTCIEISASSEDLLSDLYAIFLYLVFNDFTGFICADCDMLAYANMC